MVAYAALRELSAAMPAGALVAQSRAIEAVDVPLSTFRLRGHGLADGDLLTVEPKGTGAALAAPLSSVALYYARRVSGDLFQLAASPGGGAVVLTGAAVGLMAMVIDLDAAIETTLEWRSRHIDQHLPAHAPPFKPPVHPTVIQWTVVLARYDLAIAKGLLNPLYAASAEPWSVAADKVQARLDKHATGVPLVGAPVVDQTEGPDNGASAWADPNTPDWSGVGARMLG